MLRPTKNIPSFINDKAFTILMPIYDRNDIDQLFIRAVDSVYENTIFPNHFILIVDGPVRQSLRLKIINTVALYKIEVVWLPHNVGIATALNIGLSKVKTEWTIRADADDYNLPTRFAEQVKLMSQGYDLTGSAIQEVDIKGRNIAVKRPPLKHNALKGFAKYRNPFNHMTVAFRTSLAKNCGGYPNIYLKEDYALWALMIKNGAKLANSSLVLVKATAGRDMYKRRGGFLYAKSEVELQKHLVMCGIKSQYAAFFHGGLRALVYLLPSWIRGFIYKFILRNYFSCLFKL
jgi:glycosyltransferase involved in cell wall biosynthesis